MLLDKAHRWLGWPQPQQIFNPPGEGARVYADFARRKIEEALKRGFPDLTVETGVLAGAPLSAETSAPLAIVCQFQKGASDEALAEAHRLAWNFSRTSLLVTLEPHRLIAWSCHCDPRQPESLKRVCDLPTPEEFKSSGTPEQQSVRNLLHWSSLITDNLRRQRPEHFPVDGRADSLLLKNLLDVRRRLLKMNLSKPFCHDLLARIIFTQYLFHRRDSDGNAFFSPSLLGRRCGGALREFHRDLGSILRDHGETYSLFRWLDERFNGDLFPGSEGATDAEREVAWQAERNAVKPSHLALLADLVSGTIDTRDQQLLLWPHYSFDTIPLEFISSVYEEFLNEDRYENKAFYTPSHLVDHVLDAVLPWNGHEWNLRILDPACGSGIFLVKAFQRIVHRWRRCHGREPLVSDLKPILAENIIGVDINPEAVRVASFSLYLAMADAIEPKHYVTREKVFPRLRGTRLIANDFFDETTTGFRTQEDGKRFDLVLGNAPWGDGSIRETSDPAPKPGGRRKRKDSTKAQTWAKQQGWPVVNNDIGPLFLAKALQLVKDEGRVALVQPAGPWLYHHAPPAMKLRQHLFENFLVEEVTNLVAIRREIFSDVIGPACILVAGGGIPSPDRRITYLAPKPLKSNGSSMEFSIEPQDISQLSHREAARDPLVWPVLALGGRRDLNLVRKLAEEPTLEKLKASGKVLTRAGVIPGNQKKELPTLRERRYFELPQFPDDVFLELEAQQVPIWNEPKTSSNDSTNFEAFKNPQLLIKQAFSARAGRLRAALVRSDDPTWGVICKKTYLSVRDLSDGGHLIEAACAAYNSSLAVYFLMLTSRMGHFITEVPTQDLLRVPLPRNPVNLSTLMSFEDIDNALRRQFALSQAEWMLVEDMVKVTLPDSLRQAPGPGRQPTVRRTAGGADEPELTAYVETLCRVLRSTFGDDKQVAATIFQEPAAAGLPVRMLTLHFDWPNREPVSIQPIEADGLLDKLTDVHLNILERSSADGGGFRRVVFLFHSIKLDRGSVRSLTIIKPDERRYWTRSIAIRDADELSVTILRAAGWAE